MNPNALLQSRDPLPIKWPTFQKAGRLDIGCPSPRSQPHTRSEQSGALMVLAIAFAHLWGVIQLLVLGSLARTVRVRTVLAAMAVGLYFIGPLTVFLQLAWIQLAASLTGTPIADMRAIASYTVDPFLEEALKLLPLAMLMLLPTVRRQWSLTDCVLVATATGSGYGLAENLYRYAGSPDLAQAVAGGWAMSIGRYTVLVPGAFNTLTSWLPPGTSFVGDPIRLNSHLVWSALGGLALGVFLRYRTRAARVVAGALFLYTGLDHAAWNASLVPDAWLSLLAKPLGALAAFGGLLAIVALGVAWWLDRRTPALEPFLAAERAASSRFSGTLEAAFSRLPWSIPWVTGFARARRACHAARAAAPEGADSLLDSLVAHRDRIDRQLTQPESPPLIPSGLTLSALKSALRRRSVIISLVLLAPSILFLVVGGWPRTAWIQRLMTGPVAWQLTILIATVSLARVAWGVVAAVRNWSATRRLPIGDDAAIIGLQLACGIGSVGLGGFALLRVLGGLSAGAHLIGNAHGADAANRLKLPDGFALSNSAGSVAPSLPGRTQPGEAAPPKTKAPAPDAESAPPQAPSTPKPQPPPAPPKPPPEDQAAKKAAKEADDAEARAAKAEADAREAQAFRQKAIRTEDAADIARSTGTDMSNDPGIAEARDRTRKANAASEAADQAALDGDDPWDPNQPNKKAADIFRREAREAAEDQKALEDDFQKRMAGEVESDKEAARNAADAMNAANAKAAEARAAADVAARGADAANNAAARAAARAADPLGTAADTANQEYAAAQANADKAFLNTDHKAYHDAQQALALAKEKADAARAAADAARDARAARVIPVDKP